MDEASAQLPQTCSRCGQRLRLTITSDTDVEVAAWIGRVLVCDTCADKAIAQAAHNQRTATKPIATRPAPAWKSFAELSCPD